MENTLQKKFIIVIILFCATIYLVYSQKGLDDWKITKKPLREAFNNLGSYIAYDQLYLEKNIFEFLKLDDYAYTNFRKGENTLSLYVGYYYTGDKLTASHSPLVCFPAQGWVFDNLRNRQISIEEFTVNFAEMEATLGSKKQLVLYWFQSYLNSTPHTYMQKLYAFYNRIVYNEQQNSFVRIAIPLQNINREEARSIGNAFIRTFYPKFVDYIENKG